MNQLEVETKEKLEKTDIQDALDLIHGHALQIYIFRERIQHYADGGTILRSAISLKNLSEKLNILMKELK